MQLLGLPEPKALANFGNSCLLLLAACRAARSIPLILSSGLNVQTLLLLIQTCFDRKFWLTRRCTMKAANSQLLNSC